jgi:hypothetical protein
LRVERLEDSASELSLDKKLPSSLSSCKIGGFLEPPSLTRSLLEEVADPGFGRFEWAPLRAVSPQEVSLPEARSRLRRVLGDDEA